METANSREEKEEAREERKGEKSPNVVDAMPRKDDQDINVEVKPNNRQAFWMGAQQT